MKKPSKVKEPQYFLVNLFLSRCLSYKIHENIISFLLLFIIFPASFSPLALLQQCLLTVMVCYVLLTAEVPVQLLHTTNTTPEIRQLQQEPSVIKKQRQWL